VVGGPLNSRLRAATEVGKARDWPEAVKTHGGPKQPRKQAAVAVAAAVAAGATATATATD